MENRAFHRFYPHLQFQTTHVSHIRDRDDYEKAAMNVGTTGLSILYAQMWIKCIENQIFSMALSHTACVT